VGRPLGRYELLRQLARGGMADVFLARRRAAAGIEKRVVLKRIRPELGADPRFVQLFVKEARLSVDLAHANIVPVFDFGRIGDELFLAMEYVDGRDLGTALARARSRGGLEPVLVAYIGAEACQALDYAHKRRIVHQDVTPRNVLLSFAGEVKLVDFGVASYADDARGRLRGTPAYMSPEQARGDAVDARSDLFSLGVVLAEALTGERLYTGPDTAAVLAQARAGRVPPLPDGVPEALRRAIEGAAQPDRDARFADARALQQALDQVVVGARAADPARPAPSHELALWLRGLFPEDETEPGVAPEAAPDSGGGRHVTFLEDGDAVSRALGGDEVGQATVRSMAETMGEETPAPEPVPPPRRRSRARLGLAAAGAAATAAIAAALLWPRTHAPPAPGPAPLPAAVSTSPPAPAPQPAPAAPPAAAPPPREERAAPRPAPARPKLHPVEINSKPWARVYIDDRYVNDTPLRTELAAGTHRLRFENPVDGSSKTRVIVVPRDAKVIETLAP
jgi:serine/threonine protein kinase